VQRIKLFKPFGILKLKIVPRMCRELSRCGKTILPIRGLEGSDARSLSGNHTQTSWPEPSKHGRIIA